MKHVQKMVWVAALMFACLAGAVQNPSPEPGQKPPESAAPGGSQADNYKLTVHSNLVFLPTRVQNKNGETVYGLRPEQFVVEDNGVPQTVTMEEGPEAASGLSLVVAVQCGISAASEFSKLKGLGAMIDAIVGDAPHEVSIVSYGEGPYLLSDFSDRPDDIRLALSKIRPCGDFHAVTIDTVYYAINRLKRRQNHYRRAILLISETRDHGSKSKLHDVVAELGSSDTMIYSVSFSPARDGVIDTIRHGGKQPEPYTFAPPPSSGSQPSGARPSSPETGPSAAAANEPIYAIRPPLFALPQELVLAINALRRNTASELASLSGGEHINFTTQKDFEQGLQRIANEIHNYYLLSFKTASAPTWDYHSLKVRVPDYPDAVIETRRSYWSGALESAPAQPQPAKSEPIQPPK